MNERIEKIADKLAEAFAWNDTPQGFDYWRGVHDELYHLACDDHLSTPPQPDQLTIDGWDIT